MISGADVELTVPLNTELIVYLPDPPFRSPIPDTSAVLPFLNFGGEGVYPLPNQIRVGATRFLLTDFPDVPGELVSFIAGVFRLDESIPGQVSLASPYSVVVRDGVGDLSSGLTLDPLLGFPELIEPTHSGLMVGHRIRWRPGVGTRASYYELFVVGYDGIIWTFYAPGALGKLVIPVFPELAIEAPPPNMSMGAYVGYMSAVYAPSFDFNNFSYLDLSSQAWRSWTQEEFRFVSSGPP